jgi:hypothetical protein
VRGVKKDLLLGEKSEEAKLKNLLEAIMKCDII